MGGVRAERRGAVGQRTSRVDRVRSCSACGADGALIGHQARGGVLRALRPHHDDPGRHRQRPAGLPDRRRTAVPGRVRDLPHRPVHRVDATRPNRRTAMAIHVQNPYFELQLHRRSPATARSRRSPRSPASTARTRRSSTARAPTRRTRTRKLPGIEKYSHVMLKRGITGTTALWDWRKEVRDGIGAYPPRAPSRSSCSTRPAIATSRR